MDAFEHWELEEQLRHVARVLGPEGLERRRPSPVAASGDDISWTDWLAMAVGLGGLLAGGVLSINVLWGQQHGMWRFGLAIALIGQAALAVGLWKPRQEVPRHGGSQTVARPS